MKKRKSSFCHFSNRKCDFATCRSCTFFDAHDQPCFQPCKVQTCTSARKVLAAATILASAGSTSFQPRVFRRQSGLTHRHWAGNVWRVDVVHARADLVRAVEVVEGIEQFHIGTRGFDGDHVGVHAGDIGCPAEVVGPLRFAQWQAFVQRGFFEYVTSRIFTLAAWLRAL